MKGSIDLAEAIAVAWGGTLRRAFLFFVLCIGGHALGMLALGLEWITLKDGVLDLLGMPVHWMFVLLYGVIRGWGVVWLMVLAGMFLHMITQEVPRGVFLVFVVLAQAWVTFLLGLDVARTMTSGVILLGALTAVWAAAWGLERR